MVEDAFKVYWDDTHHEYISVPKEPIRTVQEWRASRPMSVQRLRGDGCEVGGEYFEE